MPQLQQALAQAQSMGLDAPDAQLLLLHVLGQTQRSWLRAHGDTQLTANQLTQYQHLCQRRLGQEPLAYITGWREFYGLALQVDARVLDPRPDTETLVDWALEQLPANNPVRVLDLGTGSGAIALAIQKNRPLAHVTAIDASEPALQVACANGVRLGLPVHWLQSNWLAQVPQSMQFDLIASNPPYIVIHDPHLAALHHEPLSALVSGTDGLDDIRHIVQTTPPYLAPMGWLMLEHGYHQAAQVRQLMLERGFTQVQTRPDLAGIDRCTAGCWPVVSCRVVSCRVVSCHDIGFISNFE